MNARAQTRKNQTEIDKTYTGQKARLTRWADFMNQGRSRYYLKTTTGTVLASSYDRDHTICVALDNGLDITNLNDISAAL